MSKAEKAEKSEKRKAKKARQRAVRAQAAAQTAEVGSGLPHIMIGKVSDKGEFPPGVQGLLL